MIENVGKGSSPHTRGALAAVGDYDVFDGIIPAYAGSTASPAPPSAGGSGSSPHTRGAHRFARSRGHHERIIPAYAGSTSPPPFAARPSGIIPAYAGSTVRPGGVLADRPDHPRIRGEHVTPVSRCLGVLRIIPAYAGSTGLCNLGPEAEPDHPRIRGEHSKRRSSGCSGTGSSPHTRGALEGSSKGERVSRIIPAYAGSTGQESLSGVDQSDHPRIRGEHVHDSSYTDRSGGSSPHTRGAPVVRIPVGRPPRIIPAYAGSTVSMKSSTPGRGDHPRIRGEHSGRRRPGG